MGTGVGTIGTGDGATGTGVGITGTGAGVTGIGAGVIITGTAATGIEPRAPSGNEQGTRRGALFIERVELTEAVRPNP